MSYTRHGRRIKHRSSTSFSGMDEIGPEGTKDAVKDQYHRITFVEAADEQV